MPTFTSAQFTMEIQKQNFWCWAAAAVSIDNSMPGSLNISQCLLVTSVLSPPPATLPPPAPGSVAPEPPPPACCSTPDSSVCDQPDSLLEALNKLHRVGGLPQFFEPNAPVPSSPPFSLFVTELNGGKPVGVQIAWRDGGGHCVVVSQAELSDSLVQSVWVENPLIGTVVNKDVIKHEYNDFVTNYDFQGEVRVVYKVRKR